MNRVGVAGLGVCVAALGLSLAEAASGWSWEEVGRRDPFIFRQPQEPGRGLACVGGALPPPPPPPPGDPAALLRKAREVADQCVRRLGFRDFDRVAVLASDYKRRLRKSGFEAEHAYERLVTIRQTALRLRAREQAEQAFGRLRIDVRGVIWEETGASALVNDRVVREGGVVEGARVKEIRRDEVLFEFKGVLVRKGVR